jgi:hypothetical protein
MAVIKKKMTNAQVYRELLYSTDGNVNSYCYYGKQYGDSSKN